jgi:anti-sigma factor ChrR (cupin superfamily)
MKHPHESTLALYAGQDLGWFARRRTARHVASCRECRDQLRAFASARDNLIALDELPAISWNRLAT